MERQGECLDAASVHGPAHLLVPHTGPPSDFLGNALLHRMFALLVAGMGPTMMPSQGEHPGMFARTVAPPGGRRDAQAGQVLSTDRGQRGMTAARQVALLTADLAQQSIHYSKVLGFTRMRPAYQRQLLGRQVPTIGRPVRDEGHRLKGFGCRPPKGDQVRVAGLGQTGAVRPDHGGRHPVTRFDEATPGGYHVEQGHDRVQR